MFTMAGKLVAGMAIVTACPAVAQQNGSNAADALASCQGITDSATRLACLDKAVAEFIAARERKELVVLDRSDMRKTRRSLFGFALPRIKLFGNGDGDEAEDIKQIDGKVVSVAQIGEDRWSMTLEDGTRWSTMESTRGFPPRSGESVNIERGALGSYLALFNKRRSIRVRRTE